MKKFIAILVALILMTVSGIAFAEEKEVGIRIPKNVMEQVLAANDATVLVRDYFFPYLEQNDFAALLFSAELNLSNGSPYIRTFDRTDVNGDGKFESGWGERTMFGKLIDNGYILKYSKDWFDDNGNMTVMIEYNDDEHGEHRMVRKIDQLRAETYRLLFGEPYNDTIYNQFWMWERGNTTFEFTYRKGFRELSYQTGKWMPTKSSIPAIHITHTVEYMGGVRNASLSCNYKTLTDGYYLVTFGVLRK